MADDGGATVARPQPCRQPAANLRLAAIGAQRRNRDNRPARADHRLRRPQKRVMGAAERDFYNFNVALRDDPAYEVVAFTAAQIPGIAKCRYPRTLAGPRYPDGNGATFPRTVHGLLRHGLGFFRLSRCANSPP